LLGPKSLECAGYEAIAWTEAAAAAAVREHHDSARIRRTAKVPIESDTPSAEILTSTSRAPLTGVSIIRLPAIRGYTANAYVFGQLTALRAGATLRLLDSACLVKWRAGVELFARSRRRTND
jgi:hypothetical protein